MAMTFAASSVPDVTTLSGWSKEDPNQVPDQALSSSSSLSLLSGSPFKETFEKLSRICKIPVGQNMLEFKQWSPSQFELEYSSPGVIKLWLGTLWIIFRGHGAIHFIGNLISGHADDVAYGCKEGPTWYIEGAIVAGSRLKGGVGDFQGWGWIELIILWYSIDM